MTDQFDNLRITDIVASLTNPRKTFDAFKLAELADSIKASGVHQPVLVRPLPGSRLQDTFDIHTADGRLQPRPTHEIVAGERRFRASKLAGVLTIPALIRDLTDHQVLEIQIIENLQREDISPLEEAEGYESLCAATGISKEDVGTKIGKSRAYVYARLKLLDLSFESKEALRDGSIDASRALLIARIPNTELQARALAEAARKDWQGEAPSVRTFQTWLLKNVMLHLDAAPFDIADSRLIEAAGSCHVCPKRTGANPDLFADVSGADICTDTICYNKKSNAHRAAMLATAEAKGMRLIEGEEARHICLYSGHTGFIGYSPLNQERNDVADGMQPTTLAALLGTDGPQAVLIENPWSKELTAAVPTAEAEALLLARGLVKAMEQTKGRNRDYEKEIQHLRTESARDIEVKFRKAAHTALLDAIHSTPDDRACSLITPSLLRAWLLRMTKQVNDDEMALALNIELATGDWKTLGERNDAQETQVRLHIQACSSAHLYKALVARLISEDDLSYWNDSVPRPAIFEDLASDTHVDLTAIRADVVAQVKAITERDIRLLQGEMRLRDKAIAAAESEKSLLPLSPAAQAKTCARGAQGAGKKTGSPAAPASAMPARKRKATAEETLAGIAAAMQGQESNSGAADASHGNEAVSGCALPDAQATATVSGADSGAAIAPQGNDTPSGFALGVGVRVRVTTDTDKLPIKQHKWASKEGIITQKMGDTNAWQGVWLVSFQGRSGGMSSFDGTQITVIGAAS